MLAEGAANEVGDGVGGPDDGESEEEEAGAFDRIPVNANRKGERKRYEQQRRRRNPGRRKGLNKRPTSPEGQKGETHDKQENDRS